MWTEVRCFSYFISKNKYLSNFHKEKKFHWLNSVVFLLIFLFCHLSSQLKEQLRYGRFSPWPRGPQARMGSPSLPRPFTHSDYLNFALKMLYWKCFSLWTSYFFKTLLSEWLWGHLILLLFMTKTLVLLQICTFLLTCVASGRFTGKTKNMFKAQN